MQPWCTPFPIFNQSFVACSSLTCFLTHIQVSQEAGKVVWYSHLSKNFSQLVVIHIVKGFSLVSEAVNVFPKFPCLFFNLTDFAVWYLVPLPFLNPACTLGISLFTYCWSLAWRILSITLLACEMNTIVLISHASKIMLKILQARLQQYMNRELPDVQTGFREGRGTRDQIANIHLIIEKSRVFQKKHRLLLHWLC